jgi:tetratricopeptide (TPR) repeat protein
VSKARSKPASVSWLPDLWVALALLVVTFGVYSQVRHFQFINYDDPEYVVANSHVRAGLTGAGIAWAFTSYDAANWFPLTWITHMLDVQLFGLDSGWHHLTNVVLHCAAALLLFAALKRMTGARWPAAFVAFVFALHPLHVESVAWVAERKDVLSAFFWCLTLWCYARYVERPSARRYLPVVLTFGLGLMAKPMIVTLPFVLLLLDYWPLRRELRPNLLIEKLPLFALAFAVSLVTYLAQHGGGAVAAVSGIPLDARLANAVVAYVTYLCDFFWPAGLSVFYPYAPALPGWQVAGSAAVLAGISYLAVRYWRTRPWLAVGWFWYLGTLVPVIGLVQVGAQSHADRYTYLPMIGVSILLAWGAADLVAWRRVSRALACALSVACVALTWVQVQYWANSETLFPHTLRNTTGNYVIHNNLANYYLEQHRNEEARDQATDALAIRPYYVDARVNLGTALQRLGNPVAAEAEYRRALEIQPANVAALSGLGASLAVEQRPGEALAALQAAVQHAPDCADCHYNLGKVLSMMGRNDEAATELATALRYRPDNADAHLALGIVLAAQGKLDQAVTEFAADVRLRPTDANSQYNLAIALARLGRLPEAIEHFREAVRLKPDFDAARKNLAIAEGQGR